MAVKKRSGLGKGLDALIPNSRNRSIIKKEEAEKSPINKEKEQKPAQSDVSRETISNIKPKEMDSKKEEESKSPLSGQIEINITDIEPNREQPRRKFDEDSLVELAESIRQYGVLQPLLVQKKKDHFEIIAGERRWRAAKIAGIKKIPVIIKELSDREIVEISLIENIQREDLNPIEEAEAYKRLLTEFHLKQDEVAERVSKSRTAVTNAIRLLKLDDRVRQMLIDDMLTTGHARSLLSIENGEVQYKLAMKVFDEKLSVRETERLSKLWQNGEPVKEEKRKPDPREELIYQDYEERMKFALGTKVSIKRKANQKGKIEIEYYSNEELERLLYLFQSSAKKSE